MTTLMVKFGAAALLAAASLAPSLAQDRATAIFAGGCFWCVESDFDNVEGVLETISGYTGGTVENPTYRQVTAGNTGHYEAVQVVYDPSVVDYDALLTAFWHSVDPTDPGGQFCDRGDSYRTAVFVADEEERAAAESSKEAVAANLRVRKEIVTPILDAKAFYPAEDYHQDYYQKNPLQYNFYRLRCGRNEQVDHVWGQNSFLGINH